MVLCNENIITLNFSASTPPSRYTLCYQMSPHIPFKQKIRFHFMLLCFQIRPHEKQKKVTKIKISHHRRTSFTPIMFAVSAIGNAAHTRHFGRNINPINRVVMKIKSIIWVRSRMLASLVTWFCYHLIAKPGNMKGAPSYMGLSCYLVLLSFDSETR